jgi:hypothetical protein
MGIGPVSASRAALERAGLKMSDMDLIELNEAFAAQVLACTREWGFGEADFERLNVHGSGISLGHPVGATGTRILATLAREMHRRQAGTDWRRCASAAARAWPPFSNGRLISVPADLGADVYGVRAESGHRPAYGGAARASAVGSSAKIGPTTESTCRSPSAARRRLRMFRQAPSPVEAALPVPAWSARRWMSSASRCDTRAREPGRVRPVPNPIAVARIPRSRSDPDGRAVLGQPPPFRIARDARTSVWPSVG